MVGSLGGKEEHKRSQCYTPANILLAGKKLKEIGAYFDIGESGVSQSSRRVSLKISADKKLTKQIM